MVGSERIRISELAVPLFKRNDLCSRFPYSESREAYRMGFRLTTLQDALSPLQFRTVVLLSLGLEAWQIADMLDTNEHAVHTCLTDSLRRTGCRDARELSVRALQECDNDLYNEMRLEQEMASLQNAAQRILQRSGVDPRVALPN